MSLLSSAKGDLSAPQLSVLSPSKTGSLLSQASVKSDLQSGLASPASSQLIASVPPTQVPLVTKEASLLANASGASTPSPSLPMAPPNSPMTPMQPMSQGPSTKLTFSDASGDLARQDIEVDLANLGFLPMDKILIMEGGELTVKYIKALVAGVFILIDMDLPGQLDVASNAKLMIENGKAEKIPYSVRVGTLDCVGLDVCGMAFKCEDNGVCMVTRKEDGTPSVVNFQLRCMNDESGVNRCTGTVDDHHTMPIVKYSDVKANPRAVARSAKESGIRIINSMYAVSESKVEGVKEAMKAAVENVGKLAMAVNGLDSKFQGFLTAKIMAYTRIMDSITMLDDFYIRYSMLDACMMTPEVKANYRSLLRNLYLKMKHLLRIIRLCNDVHELRTPLNEIAMMEQAMSRVTMLQGKLDRYVLELDTMTSKFNIQE